MLFFFWPSKVAFLLCFIYCGGGFCCLREFHLFTKHPSLTVIDFQTPTVLEANPRPLTVALNLVFKILYGTTKLQISIFNLH